jgi:hypothetical protein
MLARRQALIPNESFYWKALVDTFLQKLATRMRGDSKYKGLLDRLRERAVPVELAAPKPAMKLTWFDRMFDGLGDDWSKRMRSITSRAALTDETILVTRLVEDRNAKPEPHDGRIALIKILCWELRIHLDEQEYRIPCVCNSRNLDVPWTCRFADGLPGPQDGAEFPFCPPKDWPDPKREPSEPTDHVQPGKTAWGISGQSPPLNRRPASVTIGMFTYPTRKRRSTDWISSTLLDGAKQHREMARELPAPCTMFPRTRRDA